MGISWLTGVAVGLREAGIDLALADRFVGTSAGAIVGTVLAAGGDPMSLLAEPPADAAPIEADPAKLAEIFSVMFTPGVDAMDARRRIGELALAAEAGDPAVHIARIGTMVGIAEWPERELVLTAVDARTGELRAWERGGAATLEQALASTTCVPGVFPPIPIAGNDYIDGGVRSSINADLALPADIVVIVEPLAHIFPRTPADRELGSAREISIIPDTAAIAAFGNDLFGRAALHPAFEAGVRQAADAAPLLKDVWPTR